MVIQAQKLIPLSQSRSSELLLPDILLLPLGLDTNHGYGKTPVINSEVSKKRAALEKRLNSIKRWAMSAREHSHRASLRYTRLWKETKAKGEARYRVLDKQLQALEA